MNDTVKHITVDNIQYPMIFDLNVMEDFQDKFGSINAWSGLIEPEIGEPKMSAIIDTYTSIINEGIDYENEKKGENRALLTRKQVGRIITSLGLESATKTIMGLTVESTKTEDDEKNV